MTVRGSPILALAQTYWDREMANDIDGVMACYADNATLVLPDRTTLSTSAAIREFYAQAAIRYPRRTVEIVDHFDDGVSQGALVWEAILYDPHDRAFKQAGINVLTVLNNQFAYLRAGYPPPVPA